MATLDEFMQAMSGKPTAASRSREFEHKGLNRKPPTLTEIQEAIRVGQLPSAFRSQEPGLQGGVPTETITGLNLSPLDLFGTGIGTKIAGLGAKGIGLAGIFAGVNAKTANLAKLELAQKLKQQVVPDREIYAKTGWTFGFPDSKPRFEIPDNEASLSGLKYQGRSGILENSGDLKNSLTHPELYKAYPETSNIQASIYQGNLPEQGSFSKPGMQYNEYFPQLTAQGLNAKSPALHELQHAIQQREGFARGGSPRGAADDVAGELLKINNRIKKIEGSDSLYEGRKAIDKAFDDVINGRITDSQYNQVISNNPIVEEYTRLQSFRRNAPKDGDEAYKRLAGEAEARLTQARMNMTPEQRAASYPLDMFDVPVNEQIVRYDEGNALSLPKTQYELAHELAQRNAALPVEQGGLGLLANNTAMERAKALGYPMDLYGRPHTNIGFTNRAATNAPMKKAGIIKSELEQLGIPVRGEQAQSGSTYLDIPGNPYPVNDNPIGQSIPIEQLRFSTHSKRYDGIPINEPDDAFISDVFPKHGDTLDTARQKINEMIARGGIRSRFAAFDPLKRNSSDLLASLLPITTTGLLANQLRQSLWAEPQPD